MGFDELAVLALRLGRMPRFDAARYFRQDPRYSPLLYKFLTPNSPSLRGILVDSNLWLASVSSFNDPFDLRARVTFDGDVLSQRKHLDDFAKRQGLRFKARKDFVAKRMTRGVSSVEFQRSYDRLRRTFGVCCFAARPVGPHAPNGGARSILMWSHYADSHRGVCFQFHVPRSPGSLGMSLPVDYSEEFIRIDWLDRASHERSLGPAFTRKASAWSYELERRIVLPSRADTLLPFHSSALRGVVLGCAATRRTELRLVALCRRRIEKGFLPVKIFRALVVEGAYRLQAARAIDLERLVSR